ncbi:TAXI family TRAP transporter solute-binding subunit [Pseudodesulfovibrio indicus]|uniref:TAXI family TRAP transporter solute-binding subunit n=1 Tax=Pseudodesulfovibrio indicus TaxID=1716143 RepID=UPI00292EA66B|nr:TAXI family TRAP transporter solute-binding subunit [Pseudodesulfovibrio indicus]
MRAKTLFILCLMLFLAACSGGEESAPKEKVGLERLKADKSTMTELKTPTFDHGKATFATIGTGGVNGVYYPSGGAIANMVNAKRDEYDIRMSVESTGGSVFNINAVLAGDMQFGMAQSDRQYQAVNGIAEWAEKGPQTKLRSVFSLHPEVLTLVAAADAGIKTIDDLRGHSVNIGNPGSGQHKNSTDALGAVGLSLGDIKPVEVRAIESSDLLQSGAIDAYFYTVGHPSAAIKEATEGKRKVVIVPISGVGALFAKYPYYVPAEIDTAFYPELASQDGKIQSFGVKATLVTSSDVPDGVVYAVTREVVENLDAFRSQHPALQGLTREGMLQGLSAPIHPGAAIYYRQSGMM